MKTLRALLTAHVQSQWNRTLRESGLAEKASTVVAFIIVGLILAMPCVMVLRYGMFLGSKFKESATLLEWNALQAQFTFAFALLGGFRNKLAFTFKEFGRYPLPRLQVLLAEFPASLFEVFPLLGAAGIFFSSLGLAIKQPMLSPFLALLTIQAISNMLILLLIAGSVKRYLLKRRHFALILGFILLTTLILVFKKDVRSYLQFFISFLLPILFKSQTYLSLLPGSQGYAALMDFWSGRVFDGLSQIAFSVFITSCLLLISAWIHHHELSTEADTFRIRRSNSPVIKFRNPAVGINQLFMKQLLESGSGRLLLFIPLMFTGCFALISSLLRKALEKGEYVPDVMLWISKDQSQIPLFGIMLYFIVWLNSDIWLNQFGWDRIGIRNLLILPISSEDILFGKLVGLMRFSLLQILVASAPLLYVYTPSIREMLEGFGAAGTLLILCTGIGHLISARYPRAVLRSGASTLRISLSWIPFVLVFSITGCLTLVYKIGAMFGSWGTAICFLIILGTASYAYNLALPRIGNYFSDQRERLLQL